MKVLVVDDEKVVREFLEGLLKEFDWQVVTAVSGSEALEKFDESIEVVVTDRRMPGMLGEEVIRKIKLLCPHVKTILMTGDRLTKEEKKVIKAAGVDEILYKPFSFVELIQVIKYY